MRANVQTKSPRSHCSHPLLLCQPPFFFPRVFERRWVNLTFKTSVLGIVESDASKAGRFGALMFVNNTVLVLGILLGIVVLHVACVSGVDAYCHNRVSEQARPLLSFVCRHGRLLFSRIARTARHNTGVQLVFSGQRLQSLSGAGRFAHYFEVSILSVLNCFLLSFRTYFEPTFS